MTARKPARPAEGGAHELGDRSSLWGLVAVILLLLFSASTFYMVNSVVSFCALTHPCVSPPAGLVGEGFVYVVTTVAGLVSALVIAQLSVTEPGKPPTLGSFRPEGRAATMVTGVVALYLLAWIATGLAALVVGVMLYPKVNQTLADIGRRGSGWLCRLPMRILA